jgi:hypothetical protein
MAIGTALNQRRGPIALLNGPARQMSVLVALAGLGFLVTMALTPIVGGLEWQNDGELDRLILGSTCGLILSGFFLWAAHSFRWTLLVYLTPVALAVTGVFLAARIPEVWTSDLTHQWWPTAAAVIALIALGLGHMLERRRLVLYGRPVFYSAVILWPLATVAGMALVMAAGHGLAAAAAALILAAVLLIGSMVRLRGVLLIASAAVLALGLALWGWAGFQGHDMVYAAVALAGGAAIVRGLVFVRHRT